MVTLAERKNALEKRLAELDSRLHVIEDELDTHQSQEHPSQDFEEQFLEREEDEVLQELGNAEQAEMGQIRAALKRIEDGTYGYCAKCGDKIAEERLDLLPATPFCRSCAV
ncbi:TraR/DksA C4-type zinc finger protein [Actibacterium sp. MT2.3-13A]|uniref:TraR/DksA family transcriptional regulator n=1 Tax=Actibacterium sp. MT2.3-13A TaxID=2828332 RepID=UPI001BA956DB|nr:TraR/DksA C4-type zinc finger protein [Actibacterium sp. MT2.3-13A]